MSYPSTAKSASILESATKLAEQGIVRLQHELDEIQDRVMRAANSAGDIALRLFGPYPSKVEADDTPSDDTLSARLEDIRRALSNLEGALERLHQG